LYRSKLLSENRILKPFPGTFDRTRTKPSTTAVCSPRRAVTDELLPVEQVAEVVAQVDSATGSAANHRLFERWHLRVDESLARTSLAKLALEFESRCALLETTGSLEPTKLLARLRQRPAKGLAESADSLTRRTKLRPDSALTTTCCGLFCRDTSLEPRRADSFGKPTAFAADGPFASGRRAKTKGRIPLTERVREVAELLLRPDSGGFSQRRDICSQARLEKLVLRPTSLASEWLELAKRGDVFAATSLEARQLLGDVLDAARAGFDAPDAFGLSGNESTA
jgi:hypothetical protein